MPLAPICQGFAANLIRDKLFLLDSVKQFQKHSQQRDKTETNQNQRHVSGQIILFHKPRFLAEIRIFPFLSYLWGRKLI